MIELDDVSVFVGDGTRERVVLDRVTFAIPTDKFFVVLGQAGAGKTVLARLLSGVVDADEGSVFREGRISFPIGFTGGFERRLSVRQNIFQASRIYDADFFEILEFVSRAIGGEDELDQVWEDVAAAERVKFSYLIGYAIPFDTYIIDGRVEVGDDDFRKFCKKMFEVRASQAGIVLTTRNPRLARRYGYGGAVLHGGKLWAVSDLEEGIEFLDSLPSVATSSMDD